MLLRSLALLLTVFYDHKFLKEITDETAFCPPPSASRAYPSPSSTDRVGTDVLSTRTLLSIKKEAIEAELKSIEALSQQFKASDSLPNEFINAWDALNRSISDYETFYLPRADGLLPIDQKAHQDFITNIRQTQKKMGLTGH